MGKKKTVKTEAAPLPVRHRAGVNVNVWINAELADAFEHMLARTRRTKTAEIEVMMEQYLKDAGLWPPPPEAK